MKMMLLRSAFAALSIAAALCLAPSPAFAASPFAAKLSQIDKTYLVAIEESNLSEIAAANLALQQSGDPLVTAFARTMIDDHTQARTSVAQFASDVQFALPVAPAASDAAALDDLRKLHGHRFDVAYMTEQEAGHRRAIDVSRQEIAYGTQRDVAGLAATLLVDIEHHYELARQDLASLNDPTRSGELNGRR